MGDPIRDSSSAFLVRVNYITGDGVTLCACITETCLFHVSWVLVYASSLSRGIRLSQEKKNLSHC